MKLDVNGDVKVKAAPLSSIRFTDLFFTVTLRSAIEALRACRLPQRARTAEKHK